MSTDIIAYKKIINDYNCINTEEEITGFTLSSRLNDYWGTHDLFTKNYDSILTEEEDRTVFNIYTFSRNKILELKKINTENNLGDDVTWFLDQLLASDVDIFHIQIF